MYESQNSIICAYGLRSPRISANEIHEWIYAQMCPIDRVVIMAHRQT